MKLCHLLPTCREIFCENLWRIQSFKARDFLNFLIIHPPQATHKYSLSDNPPIAHSRIFDVILRLSVSRGWTLVSKENKEWAIEWRTPEVCVMDTRWDLIEGRIVSNNRPLTLYKAKQRKCFCLVILITDRHTIILQTGRHARTHCHTTQTRTHHTQPINIYKFIDCFTKKLATQIIV